MKYLLLSLLLPLASCSKDTEPGLFIIDVYQQDNINTMSFVLDIETEPFTYTEDFLLEVVVIAKPIMDVSSEEAWLESVSRPTYYKAIDITCQDLMMCNGKLVHGLGYRFDENFDSDLYYITFDVLTEQDYIERVD
jgi:hypothetical protein